MLISRRTGWKLPVNRCLGFPIAYAKKCDRIHCQPGSTPVPRFENTPTLSGVLGGKSNPRQLSLEHSLRAERGTVSGERQFQCPRRARLRNETIARLKTRCDGRSRAWIHPAV